MRIVPYAFAAALAVDPRRPPPARVPLALLRAEGADWQEGLTDGRVCLDARVWMPAADSSATVAGPARRWAAGLLAALLRENAGVSVYDPAGVRGAGVATRRCVPSGRGWLVSLGVPVVRGDTARTLAAATTVRAPPDTSDQRLYASTLVRRRGRWLVVAGPRPRDVALPAGWLTRR